MAGMNKNKLSVVSEPICYSECGTDRTFKKTISAIEDHFSCDLDLDHMKMRFGNFKKQLRPLSPVENLSFRRMDCYAGFKNISWSYFCIK